VTASSDTLIPVADLLTAGKCSPPCLLAREPIGCTCRCGGEHHGALIGVQVPADKEARPVPPMQSDPEQWHGEWPDGWSDDAWWRPWWDKHDYGWGSGFDVLDMACPVHSATAGIGWCLSAQRNGCEIPVWAQENEDGWSTHADPGGHRSLLSAGAASVQSRFLAALLSAGRCRAVSAGERAVVWGFGTRVEAQVTGAILGYLAHGSTRTALECIALLGEQSYADTEVA
jgi:hypothetical protein